MFITTLFPRDLLAEIDRLQRDIQQAFEGSTSIRGVSRGFPQLNVGSSDSSIDIYAFVPGVDPASLDVQIERGLLTISGQRAASPLSDQASKLIDERFSGAFRRVVSLPEDVDTSAVTANYRDGVLRISIARHQQAQRRRIAVQ
jgi:HSP20 family protein